MRLARPTRIIPMLAVAALSLAACSSNSSKTPAAAAAGSPSATTSTASTPGETTTLTSATKVDVAGGAVTLPLYQGTSKGTKVYYVITDSSDPADAQARGLDPAPKLALALGTKAVQKVSKNTDGTYDFPGTVDFSPERAVTPGKEGFPPAAVKPGAVGDALYSPLITIDGKTVLNATQVANDSGQHDGIISIDKPGKTVTLRLLNGFTGGKPVLYLRLDASVDVVAALEASTLAPNLDAAPGLGSNDPASSARSAIIPIVNGARGASNPLRQGLQSAVLGEGDPLNVQQTPPGDPGYSPLWDVTPVVWTDAAIKAGKRVVLKSAEDVKSAFEAGLITSGGDKTSNSSLGGAKAAGFISNCPTVAFLAVG